MRGFASLFAYLAGVLAIISIGVIGLMALQSPTERPVSAPDVAVDSPKELLSKPVKQTAADHKKTAPEKKHRIAHVTNKRQHEAPTVAADDAYGYAPEPRRIDPNPFLFFGRGPGQF